MLHWVIKANILFLFNIEKKYMDDEINLKKYLIDNVREGHRRHTIHRFCAINNDNPSKNSSIEISF